MRPSSYMRLAAGLTLLSMALVHVAIFWTFLVNVAVIVTAGVTPAGLCMGCLAHLGEDRSKLQQVCACSIVCDKATGIELGPKTCLPAHV